MSGGFKRKCLVQGPLLQPIAVGAFLSLLVGGEVRAQSSRALGKEAAALGATQASEVALQKARQFFAEGRELLLQENYADALTRFQSAIAIKETPGLRYHEAYCLEALGQLLEAKEQYERARELLNAQPASDVEPLLQPAFQRLESLTPELSFSETHPQQIIWLNGRRLSGLQALRLNPGEYSLLVEQEGYVSSSQVFILQEREKRVISTRLEPSTKGPLANEWTEQESSSSTSLRPYVIGGSWAVAALGAAATTAGVFFFQKEQRLVNQQFETVDQLTGQDRFSCLRAQGDIKRECDALSSALQREERAQTLLWAGVATTVLGVTTAWVSSLVWPHADSSLSIQVAAQAPGAPEGGWIEWSGSF